MRKVFVLMVAAVLLAGCVNDLGRVTGMFVNPGSGGDVNVEPIEMTLENKLIDMENPIDERAVFQKAMEKQRSMLKPGFITDDYGIIEFRIQYYTYDDSAHYQAIYQPPGTLPLVFTDGMTLFDEAYYDEIITEFQDAKKLNTKTLTGLYGLHGDSDYPSYQLWGKADEMIYNVNIGNEEGFEHEKLLQLIGKSMKTEADGAYDPMYRTFNLDMTKVKFPSLHQDYAEMEFATIRFDGYEDNTMLTANYSAGDSDRIYYTISEKEKEIYGDDYELVYEIEMYDGILVDEYQHIERDDRIFHWTDDNYFYEIELKATKKSLIESEDVYDLIHSALQDRRTFENTDVFAEVNTEPKLGKNEKNLNDLLEK